MQVLHILPPMVKITIPSSTTTKDWCLICEHLRISADFEVTVPTINEHLKTIFASEELTKNATIRNFRIAAAD